MSLQISLSETSFVTPGHYFVKLKLGPLKGPVSNPSQQHPSRPPSTATSTQRTEVSPSTTHHSFKNNTFTFPLPASHPFIHKTHPPAKKDFWGRAGVTSPVPGGPTQSLILHAYRIVVPEPDSEQTNQDPSVELMGSASIVLYPNESLSSGTMDIRVIYFQSLLISEDSIEGLERPNSASAIGKAILCISLNPVEPGQSVALPKPRLDPVESFKQIPESAFSRQSLAESETLNMESDSNEKKEPEEMGQLKRALNGRHNRGQGDGNEPDIKTILKDERHQDRVASIDDEQLPSLNSFLGKSDPNILEVLAQHTATQPPNTSKAEERQKYNDRDIDQRQRLIDKLLEELDGRTEAVRKVGQELYRMREKNAQNETQISNLKKQLSEADIQASKILNTIDLDLVSEEELKKRYAVLADRLQGSVEKCKSLTEKLEVCQEKVIEKNELEKRMLEIQQAHTAQQVYVQKLQDKLSNLPRYKSAIRIQETVIEKLEGLLEAALQKAKESGGEPSSLETLPERNESTEDPEKEDLKRRLAALESSRQRDREVSPRPEAMSTKGQKSRKDSIGESGLDDFRRELENERRRLLRDADSDDERSGHEKKHNPVQDFELLMRAEKAEARVKALENELVRNAKDFARRLTEAQVQASKSASM